MLVVYRHFLGESHPAAGERSEGVFGGRGERVDGARSESGAAREQAVVGEGVEGFSQYRRGVHDDLLQRVHRRGACLHRGIPRDLQLAHHLDGAVRSLGDGRRLTRQYGPRGDLRVDGVGLGSGRPGSLLTLAPHRSGRAGSAASGSSTDGFATRRRVPAGPGSQAMATAIPKAYLASSAIRCRDVETGPNLGVLAVFPSTGATCRCPLPSTGSRGLNSPASAVL